ncbi:SusC/RagA family TonB-linked outer membrane protein [Chitinophaga cymbidii]|nr:SusC/RagA family TonB-linked outer membrane protein [Chitinophaga cymbidii]
MRMLTIMLFTACLSVHATGTAQNVTLSGHSISIKQVFAAIEQQTGYVAFYNEDILSGTRPVTVSVNDMPLKSLLDMVLKNQPLDYMIQDKTIILSRKALPAAVTPSVAPAAAIPPVRLRITDTSGQPLPGASVSIRNSKISGITDADGVFNADVKEGDVLLVSFVGHETSTITITPSILSRATLSIALQPSVTRLQEIAVTVNTGYQVVAREKMTGATVSVGSGELEKRYTPNILDNLEGRAPGLVIYRGTTSIRGIGTINANKNPLIVLDGLPVEGSVADINPYDVANITVLKDAAAAAIYGARAANGVIVITTKKAKGKRTTVEFSSDMTVTQKPDLDFNLMTPAQQIDKEGEVFAYLYANTGGAYPNTAAAIAATDAAINRGSSMSPLYYAYYRLAKGDITQSEFDQEVASLKQNNFRRQFKDNALRNGLLQQYNLAVRSAGDKFQSNLVLNYKTSNTGIINAYDRQLNLFYKGAYEVAPWLNANYGVNTVLGYGKESNSSFATSGLNAPSYQPLLDAGGNRVYYATADYNSYNTNPASQPLYDLKVNHLDELGKDFKRTNSQHNRYYLNLTAKVIPGLTLTPQFQYESDAINTSAYSEEDSYIMRYLKSVYTTLLPTNGGKLATTHTRGDYWTARGQAQYQRRFGKHAVDVIAGTEFRQTRVRGTGGLLLGYDDQLQSHATTSVSFPALNAYRNTTAFKPGFSTVQLYETYLSDPFAVFPETVHRFNSNYANATYTFDDRYNAFGSFRVDYADVFGLDERFRGKPLWSAGLGWNIHNESFMEDVQWINFLKLRTTYGVTGNIVQGVSSFLTANSTLVNTITSFPMSVVTNAANPELRWEKTATTNVGVDFSLLDNRLNGSLDLYRKKGSDLLVTTRLDPSEGFTSQIINNGRLLNKGIELNIQYEWFSAAKPGDLRWMTGVVLSRNKNRITYIDEVATTPVALAQGGYKVGYPVNALYAFQYKGLDANGQPQWLAGNGDLTTLALTANDMNAVIYAGTTDPQINTTLTNELYYKGFSLNVLAVYYGGQSLRAVVPEVVSGVSYGSMPAYLADSWEPGKTNTIIPGYGKYSPGLYPGTRSAPAYHLGFSDAFVRKGDFIKIRSATVGYQLPQQWTRKIAAQSVRLRFQANNPKALWTRNDIGIDPETGGARVPASYVFGINVNY